jgi:tetratricopeptide (TPR) repeat protein
LYSEAIVLGVTPRARIFSLVALAAVVASGVVVIGVLATRSNVPTVKPRPGTPPLALDFGLRTDPEARDLERAETLYNNRRQKQAAPIFKRYHSVEAEIGSAFAAWPADTVRRLQTLAAEHPKSSLIALHLGFALYWSRRDQEAVTAWRAAEKLQPDSHYAVTAADFLHPRLGPPGLPTFVPSFQAPRRISALPAAQQVAVLREAARTDGADAKILYGVALQRLYRPVSAEREFAAAAREEPSDPEARVARAVGLFSKDDPSLAFSRLGPLVRVFPRAQTVRLHLGLLLLWIREFPKAREELRKAVAEGPGTPLGKQASQLLEALGTS